MRTVFTCDRLDGIFDSIADILDSLISCDDEFIDNLSCAMFPEKVSSNGQWRDMCLQDDFFESYEPDWEDEEDKREYGEDSVDRWWYVFNKAYSHLEQNKELTEEDKKVIFGVANMIVHTTTMKIMTTEEYHVMFDDGDYDNTVKDMLPMANAVLEEIQNGNVTMATPFISFS